MERFCVEGVSRGDVESYFDECGVIFSESDTDSFFIDSLFFEVGPDGDGTCEAKIFSFEEGRDEVFLSCGNDIGESVGVVDIDGLFFCELGSDFFESFSVWSFDLLCFDGVEVVDSE